MSVIGRRRPLPLEGGHASVSFNVMPFGLCNAPATFQRLMDCTMRGLNYEVCLIYVDDIIVFSADVPTHFRRLEMVLACLRKAKLKLKPSKCSFLQRRVEFFGYRVLGISWRHTNERSRPSFDGQFPQSFGKCMVFLGCAVIIADSSQSFQTLRHHCTR